jgi:ABC-2 type transport system permease protein
MKRIFEVAKFEFLKITRKKSFWIATLFFPFFIGIVALVSGLSSAEAAKQTEKPMNFSKVYIYDPESVIPSSFIISPLVETSDLTSAENGVKADKTVALVQLSDNFYKDLSYNVYYRKDADFIGSASLSSAVAAIIKQSAIKGISDPGVINILNGAFVSQDYSYDSNGNLAKEGYEKYILPIASLVIFFMAVYISSSFLLQSVSAEKENRMIETILSIVDKKSLMFGKMIGLMGSMFLQLSTWIVFGLLIYRVVLTKFNMPIPIDLSNINLSLLPLNIFLIIAGFLFFAAIMTGTGAIGTGAEDSRNLSSIFIILSIFPIYLMQVLITNPQGTLAVVLSYFPFTSFMVLLIRNSFGALPVPELILGIVTSILYVVIAMLVALKLFELGCLMYNRRPTFKEVLSYLIPKR